MDDVKIVCRNCGWSWKESENKKNDDLFICHKCGFDNKFRGSKNNFKNIVQQNTTLDSGDGLIYGGISSSGVIPYNFSQYLIVKDYSVMSCDALKAYSIELYNVDTSQWMGINADKAKSELNALRNSVDLIINSKCANINTISCGVGTWSISPALPAGLSINPNSGVISGKTNSIQSTIYTITFKPLFGNPISAKWALYVKADNNILAPTYPQW